MAEMARETLKLERILFVPTGDPPHKQDRTITAAHHRQSMVELAIEGNPHFELCLIDLERPGPHYSVDTVRLIRERYDISADACFFIIGSDSLADLPIWHDPEKLVPLCRLAVAHRPSYQPDISHLEKIIPGLGARLDWVQIPAVDFASSTIRKRLKNGQSVRYQVSDSVWRYIYQYKLYQ